MRIRVVFTLPLVSGLVKHSLKSGGILLLLVMVVVLAGITGVGCIAGSQPRGWSGVTVAGG